MRDKRGFFQRFGARGVDADTQGNAIVAGGWRASGTGQNKNVRPGAIDYTTAQESIYT
jgi:hypothetical protein